MTFCRKGKKWGTVILKREIDTNKYFLFKAALEADHRFKCVLKSKSHANITLKNPPMINTLQIICPCANLLLET